MKLILLVLGLNSCKIYQCIFDVKCSDMYKLIEMYCYVLKQIGNHIICF